MKFHAVEFKTVIKSLSLGIKYLSCEAAVCLRLAMIFFYCFLHVCHALNHTEWYSVDSCLLGKLDSALG